MKEWTGTKWFIEGDISQCFEHINHTILLSILREKIHDNRFLRLIQGLLQAGYLEDWKYHRTLSGTPQGGVISPILANIYMDRLDKFVEEKLLPAFTRGERRRHSKPYFALKARIRNRRQRGKLEEAKELTKELQRMPSSDPNDPNYRRLHYVRYADDFLLGFIGSKTEAEEIKRLLREFLHERLDMELSEEKTVITHASTEAAHFLGYEIVTQYADDKHDAHGQRKLNGKIGLRVAEQVVKAKCALYMERGKPIHRTALIDDDDFSIIAKYQGEYRGVVQYYMLAQNVSWFWTLHRIMRWSLLKTLAYKHKTSVMKMIRKYESTITTDYGSLKCLEIIVERDQGRKPLVARFGGIPLRRQKTAILVDHNPVIYTSPDNELLKRFLADKCELCGRTGHCEVHHIRRLADLQIPGRKEKPEWVKRMAARRRKTLVVCSQCHDAIHAGRPTPQPILE